MYFIIILIISQGICQDDPVHTSIIYGSSDLGYYYVNLYVGSPPQRQSVIVNTGGSITAFPCDACQDCGTHQDPYFNRNASLTVSKFNCSSPKSPHCDECVFESSYLEGSYISGFYLQDDIYFGDLLQTLYDPIQQKQMSVNSVFGCSLHQTNNLKTQQVNGILGLSPRINKRQNNIVESIYEKESHMANFFSICISRLDGYMTIGQYDKARHQINSPNYSIPYNPVLRYQNEDIGQYSIQIDEIKANNNTIFSDKNYKYIVESGTTFLHVPSSIYNAMVSKFKCNSTLCPKMQQNNEGPHCYTYNESIQGNFSQFASYFPTYYFKMQDFIFDWTPIDYLTKSYYHHDSYCLPVAQFNYNEMVILGQVWMRNWDIGFDLEHEKLIFVRSNCSSDPVRHTFNINDWIDMEQKQIFTATNPKRYILQGLQNDESILNDIVFLLIVTFICIAIVIYVCKKRNQNTVKVSKEVTPQVMEEETQPESKSIEVKWYILQY